MTAAIVMEPYDWATTIGNWSQGDVNALDFAGLLPFIPTKIDDTVGGIKKITGKTDDIADLAKKADEIDITEVNLSRSTSARSKFEDELGVSLPQNYDLDHTFPIQLAKKNPANTAEALRRVGVDDINDPSVVQGLEMSLNRGIVNQEWRAFLKSNPNPSSTDILKFRETILNKYPGIRIQ